MHPTPAALTGPHLVIRRTDHGWRVGDDPAHTEPELTSAMVLADLLGGRDGSAGRPATADPRPDGEADRLRAAVRQLEYALSSRVVIEQAIGVLAERGSWSPREAFERLRRSARSRGRRVQDLAREVVASAGDLSVRLPPELPARR
ncbi:MAG: ANTAR domain-containing protein [Actinomycetota bacterium]|nr:ANTAR domain-containing protein [Actinomycetota bacterium]